MVKLSKLSQASPASAREDEVEAWLTKIEEMRSNGDFDWADSTLSGIYDTIVERKLITEGQKRALRNIAEARHSDILEGL